MFRSKVSYLLWALLSTARLSSTARMAMSRTWSEYSQNIQPTTEESGDVETKIVSTSISTLFTPPASNYTADNATVRPSSDDVQNAKPMTESGDSRSGDFAMGISAVPRDMALPQPCRLKATDPHIRTRMEDVMSWHCVLIEYTFSVKGYKCNPLAANNSYHYKNHVWARVTSGHGHTLLNLAFNYGVLSLMTLTLGVEKLNLELEDIPMGCLHQILKEEDKVTVVLDLVLRDLKYNSSMSVIEGRGNVCNQIIRSKNSKAHFLDRCCYRRMDGKGVECFDDVPNRWLKTLDILFAVLMVAVFVFGPILMPAWIYSTRSESIEYGVFLKEQLYRTMVIHRQSKNSAIRGHKCHAEHILDLRKRKDFARCRRILQELPSDTILPIKIDKFDILVNYQKLLPENRVPVGLLRGLFGALFLCKIRHLEPFEDCCQSNAYGHCRSCKPQPWHGICAVVGRVLLVLSLPIPFYIRLVLYYLFESPEITDRQTAAEKLGLERTYDCRLLQFLTPTHPLYVGAFLVYLAAGLGSAWGGAKRAKQTRYREAIIKAFEDLNDIPWLNAIGMVVKNCLLPIKRYGMFGILLGFVIWPIIFPLSAVVCLVHCLPIVFLTSRIIYHVFRNREDQQQQLKSPNTSFAKTTRKFELELIVRKLKAGITQRRLTENLYSIQRMFADLVATCFILATLYSGMLMVAEVTVFLFEVICFVTMGLIVNSGKVYRYESFVFLIALYSYDTYANVSKQYLRLNKSLFSEIRMRVKDLEEYTSLPAHLQHNRGFKACENSEQAEYELDDDISNSAAHSWDINDLILFVDTADTPRIPKQLFEEVCKMQVVGNPGPVYRTLLKATAKFLTILTFLVFVFLVVMSFGESYKMSSTSQTVATMAGGFMPFVFIHVLRAGAPPLDTGLVSFRSKLEEIIQNFRQTWPMCDFVFDLGEKPDSQKKEDGVDWKEKKGYHELDENGNDATCIDEQAKAQEKSSRLTVPIANGIFTELEDNKERLNCADNRQDGINKDGGKAEKDTSEEHSVGNSSMMFSNLPEQTTNELIQGIKTKLQQTRLESAGARTRVDLLIVISDNDEPEVSVSSDLVEEREKITPSNSGRPHVQEAVHPLSNSRTPLVPTPSPCIDKLPMTSSRRKTKEALGGEIAPLSNTRIPLTPTPVFVDKLSRSGVY